MRWPRPVEPVDRLLGMPADVPLGALACFDPRLPPRHSCDETMWTAVRVRFDERWREHHGPVGDGVRAMVKRGELLIEPVTGLLLDPSTFQALTTPTTPPPERHGR